MVIILTIKQLKRRVVQGLAEPELFYMPLGKKEKEKDKIHLATTFYRVHDNEMWYHYWNKTFRNNIDNVTLTAICNSIYTNDSTARAFIDQIDDAIDNISLRCTKIGAYMNRLDSAIDSTDVQRENLTEAVSTIKDADAATESSNYIKYQILQQATATLLSTANQQPSIALNLI